MIRSFSEIVDDLMTELVTRTPFTNLSPSAALRCLLEVIAKVVADLYALVKTVMAPRRRWDISVIIIIQIVKNYTNFLTSVQIGAYIITRG